MKADNAYKCLYSYLKSFLFIEVLYLAACREPYIPPISKNSANYLVVSGFLNSGGPTYITLTRTRALSDTIPNQPELGAQLSVIGALGENMPLTEKGDGLYEADQLNLNTGEEYQLQILTSSGSKYLSDTISLIYTPPIDSVNWTQTTTGAENKLGVNVYVSTHNSSSPLGYYRWEYEETWEYNADYESYASYDTATRQFIPRDASDYIYHCWTTKLSSGLVLANTSMLSQNLIYQQPVVFIPKGSIKLTVGYSVLVRQFSISKNAYDYWTSLQQTNDLTGSIFDPMPTQVTGNFHSLSNPTEPVLGYISATAANEQRIFISYHDVDHWGYVEPKGCIEYVLTPDQFFEYFGYRGYIPTGSKGPANYGASLPECADCRTKGGINKMPPFWP
jgi:hypothetical protein